MIGTEEQVEIKVTEAWVRLIHDCLTIYPNGDLRVKIVNSEPTVLLDWKPNVRFDKPRKRPTET